MMNNLKKLDRFKQWAGERMGGEAKTSTSDEFKSLETEMNLRQDGMDRLHHTMTVYVKSMSKRKESEDKEKMLPVDVLAQAMISHGEEFEANSLFGTCLTMMGQANEKVARVQDSYVQSASENWLESLERSLTQMKEYQAARKKLESRRLAYDATLSKMQKAKKEDFRMEEELRAQRIKYEESSDDVYRRMGEIQESEAESMVDLGAFLDAEFEYYDRCRDIMANLRRQWPAGQQKQQRTRSRSTIAHSFGNGAREESPPPLPEPENRHAIGSRVKTNDRFAPNGGYRLPTPEYGDRDRIASKPGLHRTTTAPTPFEGPTTVERMGRTRSDHGAIPPPLPRNRRSASDYPDENTDSSPGRDRYGYADRERASSPTLSVGSGASHGRVVSRSSSNNTLSHVYNAGAARKQPPPPPPPVGKKRPPPPPPPKKTSSGL